MIGCRVAWKCLVACWLGESSQQPTWPHVRQIRKCSHSLPLFRHSSQPRALGVTSRMPPKCVQPFAMSGSRVLAVEQQDIDAPGGEVRQVSGGRLALGAAESFLN